MDELCVDTGDEPGDTRAYCVKTDNFFRVPSSAQQRVTGEFELHMPSNSKPFAADALLVDDSRSRGLMGAQAFELSALWEPVPVRPGAAPRQVMRDRVHCVGCYNLALQPLSDDTNLLRARVDIRGAEPAYLYLITIS